MNSARCPRCGWAYLGAENEAQHPLFCPGPAEGGRRTPLSASTSPQGRPGTPNGFDLGPLVEDASRGAGSVAPSSRGVHDESRVAPGGAIQLRSASSLSRPEPPPSQ